MTQNPRVYLDMMILSSMCGAPVRPDNQAAVDALTVGVRSGLLTLCRGWEHDTELSGYQNRARRACVKQLLREASLRVTRSWLAEQHRVRFLSLGISRGDAAHLAGSVVAGAVFLTLDKELLDLRGVLGGATICTPLEYVGGDCGSENQEAKQVRKAAKAVRVGRRKQDRRARKRRT
jgi:hypothetical protein